MIKASGSVRIDLLGGTVDLEPINLILNNAMTLNLATSLMAEVEIEELDFEGVEIRSVDYDSLTKYKTTEFSDEHLRGDFFGPLRFVAQILIHLNCTAGIKLTLKSGSPAGAGLGGSSAMGVTLYKALAEYKKLSIDHTQLIKNVRAIEARDLECGPTGYQDYFPAMYGGVLALRPNLSEVEVEQLYSQELCQAIEKRMTLVFSGQTRLSGINNWEVYKAFFDGDQKTKSGLQEIATLTESAYQAIKSKNFELFFSLIKKEGQVRAELFPNILTAEMNELQTMARAISEEIGLKICGAGGGGCFVLIHPEQCKKEILELIGKLKMTELPFSVSEPL